MTRLTINIYIMTLRRYIQIKKKSAASWVAVLFRLPWTGPELRRRRRKRIILLLPRVLSHHTRQFAREDLISDSYCAKTLRMASIMAYRICGHIWSSLLSHSFSSFPCRTRLRPGGSTSSSGTCCRRGRWSRCDDSDDDSGGPSLLLLSTCCD